MRLDYSAVRGFNYQPSWGTTSLENWLYFDARVFEAELRQGKKLFPKFNAVRYWLSWDAYYRRPEAFKANFETALAIADSLGLTVVPCLLNRWHDLSGYDNGGIYLENFLLAESWCYYRSEYQAYIEDIVQAFAGDQRVLVWDICNEPFSVIGLSERTRPLIEAEMIWLTELWGAIKAHDDTTPVGVSVHPNHGREGLERVVPISDVLLIHPYFQVPSHLIDDEAARSAFVDEVAMMVAVGREAGLPELVTETCWGSESDQDRVRNIEFSLSTLTSFGLGFMPYALHYSGVADLHRAVDGYVGIPGFAAFIEKDGSVRPGHEIYNRF
ncbi:MAG: cellulase family glycosylhydrolase [Bifidobacteriaceae bacterium]|jgi:hypothetical protein|nr:cellulase family glycosylhydrolase [Bifidobacteriaceae bacterium]